jgi:hypothetical protein
MVAMADISTRPPPIRSDAIMTIQERMPIARVMYLLAGMLLTCLLSVRRGEEWL